MSVIRIGIALKIYSHPISMKKPDISYNTRLSNLSKVIQNLFINALYQQRHIVFEYFNESLFYGKHFTGT